MASQTGDFNAKWTEELTTHFVNLLIDEIRKGNQSSQTFNRNGWTNILNEFNKKTGLSYSIWQLKNKYNKLRVDYSSFKKLLSTTGFEWNHANRTVTMDNESIWELHIQENKKWKTFKKQGLRQWPELQMLFDDTYATGDNSVGNAEFHQLSDDHGVEGIDITTNYEEVDHVLEPRLFGEETPLPQNAITHRLDRTPNAKRRRSGKSDFSNTCKAIQDMIKSKVSQSQSTCATSVVNPVKDDPYSEVTVSKILNNMTDLDDALFMKAVEKSIKSKKWRIFFVTSGPDQRMLMIKSLRYF